MTEARNIRLPGLLDLVVVKNPAAQADCSAHPTLDRRFGAQGPVLNRLIGGRIASILSDGRTPLPALLPRSAPGRAEAQQRLEACLAAARSFDPALVGGIAAALRRGDDHDALGVAVQAAIGRLFQPGYVASPETWQAAVLLDEAARSLNPLRWMRWRLSGEVTAARRRLFEAAGSDRLAMHGTAVAVHSLVRSLGVMGELARRRPTLTGDEAVTASLVAPDSVLRQAEADGGAAGVRWRAGALVLLKLGPATRRTLRRDLAFLSTGWSRCPAHGWVPALMTAVWIEIVRRPVAMEAGHDG